ncbi:hypothetical protein N7489_003587 [Penicillium chrysogenum]|uniref:Uncharacterized protein n=1 Tax=Penicillium chrysogenum TaxID=5076 RepID=A0ABQ8W8X8_PENCH|nr:uncharacterized protein N7489_003587 [Penicillium chrysogenum]KAJ5253177.1 hypothetical protein N7489_003587 [Penicillium chrysogenum]KAJ5260399.1 hypothetical protein N7505_009780 [Penicillium chrysogenum]KAJ6137010.1 hypothetical protein N7497_012262 [Penicillium chrysogenum]
MALSYLKSETSTAHTLSSAIPSSFTLQAFLRRFDHGTFGPLISLRGFHPYLRANVPIEETTKQPAQSSHNATTPPLKYHIRGWYPEYREYTKANYRQINRPERHDGFGNAMNKLSGGDWVSQNFPDEGENI